MVGQIIGYIVFFLLGYFMGSYAELKNKGDNNDQ